jgi:hypothetical protein
MFPVENVWEPSYTVEEIENACSKLPTPEEWIDKEYIP